jgi:cell division protein FtsI/penicillin-binding protein 2
MYVLMEPRQPPSPPQLSNPRVAVVVLIEQRGFGAGAAAPASKQIYSSSLGLR